MYSYYCVSIPQYSLINTRTAFDHQCASFVAKMELTRRHCHPQMVGENATDLIYAYLMYEAAI